MIEENDLNNYDAKNFNTVEDFQNFINSHNIERPTDFKKFPKIYAKLQRKKLTRKVKYLNRRGENIPKTAKEFQDFIDDNDIKNATDFYNRFKKMYCNMNSKGFTSEVTYPNPQKPGTPLKTLEEFQDFIDKHPDINSPVDLINNYPVEYKKLCRLHLADKIKYRKPIARRNESYKEPKDFQKFIDVNQVLSAGDFCTRFNTLYRRLVHIGLADEVIYPKSKISVGELIVKKLLDDMNLDYKHDRKSDFLSLNMRLDFIIEKYKIAIEYQGTQHFLNSKNFFNRTLEEQIELDKLKYEESKKAGYTILYVVFPEVDRHYSEIDFDNLDYFDKIYFSLEDLKTKILEIIENKKSSGS